MRKNAPKTGRTWRSEENRKVLAQNRSNVYKTSFYYRNNMNLKLHEILTVYRAVYEIGY